MARSNTPSTYKCSTCGVIGHNVRACPSRPAEELSVTARLRLERAERKTARLSVKAEKEAAKAEKAVARAAAKVERDDAKAAAKAAKVAAKAPYVAVVEPVIVIKPFLVDEIVSEPVAIVAAEVADAFDIADLPSVIVIEDEPTIDALVVEEVDTSDALAADPDLAALLASIGINNAA